MIAGPNGSGKSTLTQRYLVGRLQIVNPDVIAHALDQTESSLRKTRLRAGREAIRRQETLLAAHADVAVETTLSGHHELALLQNAQEAGYTISLVYIGIDSPDVSFGRVRQRVATGGHDIPPEDVERRYNRSLHNLAPALQRVDRAFILDNSGRRRRLLLAMERGRVKYLSRNLPSWAHAALPTALITLQGEPGLEGLR